MLLPASEIFLRDSSRSHQSILTRVYQATRLASTSQRDPLERHKLNVKRQPKTDAIKDLQLAAKNKLAPTTKTQKRGTLAKLLNWPERTLALKDDVPDIFWSPEERPHLKSRFTFYNNFVIYDFPKLPPVKQSELKQVQAEYHGMLADKLDNETIWLPIFRMPGIVGLRAVARFKMYLTIVSSYLFVKEIYNLVCIGVSYDAMPAATLAAITFGGLIFVGNNYRQLVVQIYTTEDHRYLRFSRFTFFGNRRDIIVPIDCVRPLTETNSTMRMPFYKLQFIKPKNLDLENDYHEFYNDTLRICVLIGGIRDRELFEEVLGKLLRNKMGA